MRTGGEESDRINKKGAQNVEETDSASFGGFKQKHNKIDNKGDV